jgi:uncharacterized protein (UPF0218 family)
MQIATTPDSDRYVITVSGEVDLASSPVLDTAIIAAVESEIGRAHV